MDKGIINFKDGKTEEISLLTRYSDGIIKFLGKSGRHFVYIPYINGGIFAMEDGIVVFENGKYIRKSATVIIDTIDNICYPCDNEFEYDRMFQRSCNGKTGGNEGRDQASH